MTTVPVVPGRASTDVRPADTHCPYCALQCAMRLAPPEPAAAPDAPDRAAPPVAVAGRDFPTNRGGLCQKGWTSARVLRATDRLTTPLVRRGGELVPPTWDEARAPGADRLTELRERHGPESVAVFGGGGLTNEKAYTLGKF